MISRADVERLSTMGADFIVRIVKLWKPVWRVLTLQLMDGMIVPKKVLSVSIERGSLWVVSGSRFLSKIRVMDLRKYTFEEGKYLSPASLVSTISLAIKELRAKHTGITLIIPRDWVIMRTVQLPSTVKENISDVITYELDRLTPLSAENAYYDFRISSEQPEKLTIIIVAARADLINQYLDALREESIDVERVTASLSSLGTLCSYVDPGRDSICLEVDSLGYEAGLIRNNAIVSSLREGFNEKDEKSNVATMVNSLKTIIATAAQQDEVLPVLVYPGGQNYVALEDQLDISIRILSNHDIKGKILTDKEDISYTAAGGILESLWPGARGFNLLGKGVHGKTKIPMAVTLILLFILLVSWIPYAMLPLQREEKRLAEINRQISLRKEEVGKAEALKKEVQALTNEITTIRDFKEAKPMALVILKELTTILPKSAWLTRIKMTGTTIDIEGYAGSASEILPKLEQSQYFKKVEFTSPTVRDTRLNADRFVVKMEIEGFGKEGGEKTKDGNKK
jgi:general secretion pathway protein L